MAPQPYTIVYEFEFSGAPVRRFEIALDPQTVSFIPAGSRPPPDWARLTHCRCTCCPLSALENEWCPVAVNVAEVVEAFKDVTSSEACLVRCIVPERTCTRETAVMAALSSIMGVIMATSDCPVMDLFKPMARFHLPFSTVEETTVRSVSMYLLRQYFASRNRESADFDLAGLDRHYERVQQVNRGFLARIEDLVTRDADNNALVILHSLAQILSMEIDYSLKSLDYLFQPGIETDPA